MLRKQRVRKFSRINNFAKHYFFQITWCNYKVKIYFTMQTFKELITISFVSPSMTSGLLSKFSQCYIGDIACKFRGSLVYICHSASVFTLTSVAYERYYAICHPLTNHLRQHSVKWIIPQTWLLAIFIHIPSMIYCGTQINKYKQSSCSCYELFPSPGAAIAYATFEYLMVYLFPAAIIIYRYTAVIRRLWQQSAGDGESGFTTQETKKHVVRMLIASSVFFFIAWTPFYTLYLLKGTGVDKRSVYR